MNKKKACFLKGETGFYLKDKLRIIAVSSAARLSFTPSFSSPYQGEDGWGRTRSFVPSGYPEFTFSETVRICNTFKELVSDLICFKPIKHFSGLLFQIKLKYKDML
jgi:hypothetical protein